jgi:uncharacterized protein YdaU (DUF1376 family)
MHYFQFNIKDYHFATKHFNYVEHGAYLVLMSVLYETEKPLTANINELIKTCMARNEEEINAIKYILENFFIKTEDGYVQKRAMAELDKYKSNGEKRSKASHVRWAKHKNKDLDANAMQVNSTSNANQETQTIKQEIDTPFVKPLDVNLDIWNNYMTLRRANNKPITDANIKALRREAANAGLSLNAVITVCVENSWISFRADWVNRKKVEENKTKEVWGK